MATEDSKKAKGKASAEPSAAGLVEGPGDANRDSPKKGKKEKKQKEVMPSAVQTSPARPAIEMNGKSKAFKKAKPPRPTLPLLPGSFFDEDDSSSSVHESCSSCCLVCDKQGDSSLQPMRRPQ